MTNTSSLRFLYIFGRSGPLCGGASAAGGALRNTIANIKREKHQGQRHEAPQRMAAHIKKKLTICSETLKELKCSCWVPQYHKLQNDFLIF